MHPESKREKMLDIEKNIYIRNRNRCTSLKSMMALAMSLPRKRNFILILAMWAGLVVRPNGTANRPLELNMYLVPSWLPAHHTPQRLVQRQTCIFTIERVSVRCIFYTSLRLSETCERVCVCVSVWMVVYSWSEMRRIFTFRVAEGDLFSSPQAQVCSLQLLRDQSIELQCGPQTSAHLIDTVTRKEHYLCYVFMLYSHHCLLFYGCIFVSSMVRLSSQASTA